MEQPDLTHILESGLAPGARRRFLQRRQNLLGLILVAFFLILAAGADLLTPSSDLFWPDKMATGKTRLGRQPVPPGPDFRLGTVPVGGALGHQMDVYSGLVWGARSALRFGLSAAALTALIGVLLGVTAAFFGGLVGGLILRVTDALLALPVIVGVFAIRQITLFSTDNFTWLQLYIGTIEKRVDISPLLEKISQSIDPIFLGLVLLSWMAYARLTYSVVLQVRDAQFVQAARALGASPLRTMLRHVLPNSLSPALVLLARDIGGMVLMQATFTFIGLGGQSEWGTMLVTARDWIIGAGGKVLGMWWVYLPSTLALVLFGMGWNLLGDGLNDWLNPRSGLAS